MAKHGRTHILPFLKKHPECFIKKEGDQVFYHPFRAGTVDREVTEVKDCRDSKLLRRMDSTWIYFYCHCGKELKMSRYYFNALLQIPQIVIDTGFQVELTCARCDQLVFSLIPERDGPYIIQHTIPNLTTKEPLDK